MMMVVLDLAFPMVLLVYLYMRIEVTVQFMVSCVFWTVIELSSGVSSAAVCLLCLLYFMINDQAGVKCK